MDANISIPSIRIGRRHRHDLGDLQELASSIAELGLLHPIVICGDGRLIAGARRLAACKSLGWKTVPVTIINLGRIAIGEFHENGYRKGFLPSEINEIRLALEPIEKARAKQRMSEGGKGWKISRPPSTRDKIAAFAGISERTLEKLAAVQEHGAADLIDAVDGGAISLSATSDLATLPVEEKREIVARGDAAGNGRPITVRIRPLTAITPVPSHPRK